MSHTTIPPKTQLKIWLRAGGRCEYRGCNEPLWKDELTLQQLNRAYLAHIIADSAGGPRGHPILSEKLKSEPSNIMLLCDTHHRLVDKEDILGHPPDLLQEYKEEHEHRIEQLTAIQGTRRTHILLFGTRIGDRQGLVSYQQAREAVLPDRYPADEKGIRIDLAHVEISEDDPEFWGVTVKHIDRSLALYLDSGLGPSGEPLNHLSIFALAPIPALIYLGKQLGDIVSADVYQRHRNTNDWRWNILDEVGFSYIVEQPAEAEVPQSRIALNVSLSGRIRQDEIEKVLGDQVPVYKVTIARPQRDFLQAKEQLELFRNEWYTLLSEIREVHGESCEIHLFPAVPNSVAVEIGRSLLPKSDPGLVVYDHNKKNGGFRRFAVI
jgi:hypothetical protein